MKFQRFLFENFCETKAGKESHEFFTMLSQYVMTGDNCKINQFFKPAFFDQLTCDYYIFDEFQSKTDVIEYEEIDMTVDDCIDFFVEDSRKILTENQMTYRDLVYDIPFYSIYYFVDYPDFFFPYLFHNRFNLFKMICDEFEIALPDIPKRGKYEERCNYYLEICKSLYEFRVLYNLSSVELNVFMYSFALMLLKSRLYEPDSSALNVWLVGSKGTLDDDSLYVDAETKVRWWAGNPNMQAGDIILIYQTAPLSRMHSVWRAYSDGYEDPFGYYEGSVWIGEPVILPEITYNDLVNNPVLSQNGYVRSHMQNLKGGRQLKAEEYSSLLELVRAKGFDTSVLPALISNTTVNLDEIENERDVELKLLEPLLMKLGYEEKHWIRQMPVRMGRGVRYYPDYAIHPKVKRGEERAAFIWEAKYRGM